MMDDEGRAQITACDQFEAKIPPKPNPHIQTRHADHDGRDG